MFAGNVAQSWAFVLAFTVDELFYALMKMFAYQHSVLVSVDADIFPTELNGWLQQN